MSNQSSVDKNQRREEARQRALKIQQEQQKRENRSRLIILLSVIAGLALVVALAVIILSKAPKDIDPTITSIPSDISAPAAAASDGGFSIYKDKTVTENPEGVPVVDLYLDFMCSHCANFETIHAQYLMDKQSAGEIVFRIHPIGILGATAAVERGSAFAALMDIDPVKAQEYAKWAFANQQSKSLTEKVQQDFIKNIGFTEEQAKDATSGEYERFIQAASVVTLNDQSLRDANGDFGTPAIFVNDDKVMTSYTDAEGFQSDVNARVAEAKQ